MLFDKDKVKPKGKHVTDDKNEYDGSYYIPNPIIATIIGEELTLKNKVITDREAIDKIR